MTKTILILAIAAAFIAGATVIGFISDYDAEAAPKKPKPIPPIDPILKPINATLNKLESYHEQLVVLNFNLVETAEGVSTSPGFTAAEFVELRFAFDQIAAEAEEISVLADTIIIPD